MPHDATEAFPTVPERDEVDGQTAWREALAYLDAELPFHAHEVFEQRWRCAPEPERLAWQALAQWGAALTHAARGNATGARSVAGRALRNLDDAVAPHRLPEMVDLARVRTSLAALLRA